MAEHTPPTMGCAGSSGVRLKQQLETHVPKCQRWGVPAVRESGWNGSRPLVVSYGTGKPPEQSMSAVDSVME